MDRLEFTAVPARTSGGYVDLPEILRAKVPGGWFVLLVKEASGKGAGFFYPDPKHTWDGRSIEG